MNCHGLRAWGIAIAFAVAVAFPHRATANPVAAIPVLTFDQASRNETELGSEYRVDASGKFQPRWQLQMLGGNASGRLTFARLRTRDGRPKLRIALWGRLKQGNRLPEQLRRAAQGISIYLSSTCRSNVSVRIESRDGARIASADWAVGPQPLRYRLNANMDAATTVSFAFDTVDDTSSCRAISYDIDDLALETGAIAPFVPPVDEKEFLDWLARSSFNFFDWNFVETGNGEGVVLERQDRLDQVSSSGQGYAIAIYVIGSERGYIDRVKAHRRVASIVNWLHRQDWRKGAQGWHGFPYHWYRTDKSPHWPAVSTIDWAMLAAGLRVARQYFADDPALVTKVSDLLSRAQWDKAVRPDGRIGMGFYARDGALDPYSWGLSFSEETELVYLEAMAADPSNREWLPNVKRPSRFGFCASWFASGFTYNWMQLWTGTLAPLSQNSRLAFEFDLHTNKLAFRRPLIGLTAVQTMTAVDEDGFLVSPRYFSNQGAVAHLTPNDDEVIQIAPAPYGAALALPFIRADAVRALREYVALGFYHEYLGLPDSVLLAGLPKGLNAAASYRHFDLNIGALGMAIDQAGEGTITDLYRSDPEVAAALKAWEQQTAIDFEACKSTNIRRF